MMGTMGNVLLCHSKWDNTDIKKVNLNTAEYNVLMMQKYVIPLHFDDKCRAF